MTDYASLPSGVLTKIAQLDDLCLTLSTKLEASRRALQQLRIERRDTVPQTAHDEYSANRESERVLAEWDRLDSAISAQQAICERLEQRMRTEAGVASDCKRFLHEMSANARLRQVEARAGDLGTIRESITLTQREIGRFQRIAVPSDDIADRVRAYVDGLAAHAAPIIEGVGSGQALRVLFPLNEHANRVHQSRFSQHEGNALLLAALMQPDRLAERLMETIAGTSISASERDRRLHALQAELTQLRYDEEAAVCALIEAGDNEVCRSSSAPAWAVLMIEVEQQRQAVAA